MKKIMKITALVLVLVIGSSLRSNVSAQYRGDVSYQTFYDELSPYGQWVDYPEYGYVWVPDAGPDFQPYSTNGHWVWTDDYEWMWVSDYDWGWAPFHYGRWFEDDSYGWVWVPGYEWSPAWVAWRDGGEYYGWAPLRPGINISVNFNIGSYNPPYNYWCFVPRRHITSFNLFSFCLERRRNVTIINQTVIINNYNYSRNIWRTGPRRYDAEVFCGRITPTRFRDSYSPGRTFYRNNEVNVYRPNVRRDDNRQFSPRNVQRFERRDGDNRNGRNDNVFRRNNSNDNGRDGNQRNNNLPGRRGFERRDDNNVRQPGENRENTPGRRIDRTDRNGNTDNPSRTFERRNNNNGNGNGNGPVRQPRVNNTDRPDRQQPQRVVPRRQEQPRQFERRSDNGGGNRQQPQRVEQRRQEQPRQFERRSDNGGGANRQQPQRVEQRRQEQPRQFERRNDNGGGNRQSGNNGNGGGRSRRN